MNKRTIEIESNSLKEAREQIKSKIPKGFDVIREEILSDGKTKNIESTGETVEAAFEKAKSKLPSNSEIIEKKRKRTPQKKVVTVEAFDEWIARSRVNIDSDVRIESILMKGKGRKGVFGIGKKPNKYEIHLFEQAVVEIKYKKMAKILIEFGEPPECAICGKKRPYKEMSGFGEEEKKIWFCSDTCWEKRGRIVGSKDGKGCPYYRKDMMCKSPSGILLPCSFTFKVGSNYTFCYVYRTFKVI